MASRKALVLAAVVVLVGAALASADTKVVQQTHTGGIMGQPPSDSTNTLWITTDKMRSDSDNNSFIMRIDQKKMYVVNHDERSFSVIDLPIDFSKLLPPEAAQMMGMMQFTVTVKPSSETKTIDGKTAHRYDVSMKSAMMESQQVVWATKDVVFPYAAARDMLAELQSLQPGMGEAFKELQKIDGFQLEMTGTMKMMGQSVEMSSKTLSIEDGGAPAGGYEPPAGYSETDFNPMMGGRR